MEGERERRRNKELQPALRMQRFVQVFSQFVVCSIVRGVLFEMNSLQTEQMHFCIEHCVSGRDRWRRKEKGENKKKQDNCRWVDEDMNKRWGVKFPVCFAAVLSIWGAINGNRQQDVGCNKMNRWNNRSHVTGIVARTGKRQSIDWTITQTFLSTRNSFRHSLQSRCDCKHQTKRFLPPFPVLSPERRVRDCDARWFVFHHPILTCISPTCLET